MTQMAEKEVELLNKKFQIEVKEQDEKLDKELGKVISSYEKRGEEANKE